VSLAKQVPLRVLLAEDDDEMRRLVAVSLRRDGCEVIEASDTKQLAAFLEVTLVFRAAVAPVDLIVSDVRMPGGDAIHVLRTLRARGLRTPLIVITAFSDAKTRAEAHALGATFFEKPFQVDELRAVVSALAPRSP